MILWAHIARLLLRDNACAREGRRKIEFDHFHVKSPSTEANHTSKNVLFITNLAQI